MYELVVNEFGYQKGLVNEQLDVVVINRNKTMSNFTKNTVDRLNI